MAKEVTLYPVVWTTMEFNAPDTKFGPDLRGPFPIEYHYQIFDNEADARALYKDLAANEPDLVRLKIEREDRFIDGKQMGGMTQVGSSKTIEAWEYPADVGKDDDERKLNPRDKVVRVYYNSMMGTKRFPPKEGYVEFLGKKNRELKSMFKERGYEDPFLKRKEAMKNMEEAKDAFSGYFSKASLGRMIMDAEEILKSGMQNGEPLDNETEMLVQQELERLKQLYIDNHGYTGMMATADPDLKKKKVMKFLKSKKSYREGMNLESIYEDLNGDEGKTISLYPFYNEELAQKLFDIGIKDGYDWEEFLGKKLGGYWEGDPEGDGTMMYNVQEPLYTELRDRIKVLLKQIMSGTIDEARYPKSFFPSMEKETARSRRHNLADVVMTRLEHEIEDGKTSGVFKYLDYSEGYSDDNWFFMLIRYLYREMNNKAFINPAIQDGVEVSPRVELNFDENSGNIAWNVA